MVLLPPVLGAGVFGNMLILLAVHGFFECPPVVAGSLSDADSLLMNNQYKQAEDAYRELIESDQTGDAYAGLAVSFAKQIDRNAGKVAEAEKILKQGKTKFPDNFKLMAAGGYVSYVHSGSVASPDKRD